MHYMVNKYPNDLFVCIDALTYAGNLETLETIKDKSNFKFVHGNICDRDLVYKLLEEYKFDYVVNFAAESHVDRSIENPTIFLETNIIGTSVLMDACRRDGYTNSPTYEEIRQLSLESSNKSYDKQLLNVKFNSTDFDSFYDFYKERKNKYPTEKELASI